MAATDEIKYTIQLEGGDKLTNHEHDAGGMTRFGISKHAYPQVDIASLTLEGAIQIYTRDYYERLGCHRMKSAAIRWKVFDIGVNCGTGVAARMLQRVLRVQPDGIIGKETLERVNTLSESIVFSLIKEQMKHYATIVMKKPDQAIWLLGWVNRAFETYKEA